MKKIILALVFSFLAITVCPTDSVKGLSCGWSWDWNGCTAYVAAADCDGFTWAADQVTCLGMAPF
jgi:hypothetical protein